MGVFVLFLPPPRPPRVRTNAIVGPVDGERKDKTTTGWTRWRAHGRHTRRRLRIMNEWRR